ncbi:hypothetical protein [Streptomyces sp. NPDC017230]|uniref:hypothetical protein n=1 Tax=unclassified Streptomyces TaxID=2593676 RepID=UPI0037A68097
MFQYEIQQTRVVELIRYADQARLAREAGRARRDGAAGAESHTPRFRRHRFARAA